MSCNLVDEFLNKLLEDNKNGNLSIEMKNKLGEMFLLNSQEQNLFCINLNTTNETEKKQLMKYMTMGWYIYNVLNETQEQGEQETQEQGEQETQEQGEQETRD